MAVYVIQELVHAFVLVVMNLYFNIFPVVSFDCEFDIEKNVFNEVITYLFKHINISTRRYQIDMRHINHLTCLTAEILPGCPNRIRWFFCGVTPVAFGLKVESTRQWSNIRRCSFMVVDDQRLVHTPLVPSGSWRSPLVLNQGFPTPFRLTLNIHRPGESAKYSLFASQSRKQHRVGSE
ncbi:uncharacterized protein DC041_0004110 [Schistosoma bovis]|uniref:Uncharacterized protein n=1 Tax=Schistosoma bovis TaxID=6184 RepID=A0A430QTK3_SCHBO|nr:uncharacterized protein DC041_0004110 [Schistosoma bovis]